MLNKVIKMGVMVLSLGVFNTLNAQDIHFSDVQGMMQWYNASLKQHTQHDVRVNLRDIRYHTNQAFQTGTALVNASLLKAAERTSGEEKNYGNVTAGAAFDKSNNGMYRNNIGLLGVSYAVNLNGRGLYMAAGFQGLLTNYRLGSNGTYQDQFDEYGPISGGVTVDPLRVGKRYTYVSLNAGWSMFQRSERLDWYGGLSLRHVNRPFTEETKSTLFRLPMTAGVQGGISLKTPYSKVDLFAMLNTKAKASELIGGIRYNFLLGDNSMDDVQTKNQSVVLGVGFMYRVKDAIIPQLQLGVGRTMIGLHYDMNMSGIRASGFTRRGFELQLTQKF
jgi:hypothetical protein